MALKFLLALLPKLLTNIAVVYDGSSITYEVLNAKANRLAHYLKAQGVGENHVVAIYLERSFEMIIAVLGIMKAGAAYLPLDCNYPEKMLRYMFEDSDASIVVTQKSLTKPIDFGTKTPVYMVDVLDDTLDFNEENLPTGTLNLNNLGYLIYTSGSTGQPKGVMLPQRALSNLLIWHREKINGQRNVLQFTTLNFDMSFLEIFTPLTTGGTLALISEQDRLDLYSFSRIMKQNSIEQLIISVPFLKNMVEAQLDPSYFESLNEVIFAGEQLLVTPAIRAFFDNLPNCKLLNYYGPSETHVVTVYEFPEKTADWPDYPPIGRAISNTKILILDEDKQLVPIGSTGEIYIGGANVAKGYKGLVEQTQERFVSDPWSDHADACLFRTGDFGKYLPDGNILYLGRKDEQVKVRGFRIEPAEIEIQLLKYPGVNEAAVIAISESDTSNHLEAFLVAQKNVGKDFIQKINLFLQEHLPSHMIPSAYNIVEKMPLTASGKINRKGLEKCRRSTFRTAHKVVKPTTETECAIIAIMEDIFKLKISITNSFTSIGGNSLLAMQIVSKLRDKFSVEVPACSILSSPSIADTAKKVDLIITHKSNQMTEGRLNQETIR